MDERLNLQDLVDLLAKKQGITKKNAEFFMKELFLLITENLEDLEPVKIKDFGTLKPILVNARKSINVNTGEEFEIAEHYKLGFNPDKTLREIVNKPFAHFESVILEEGVTFENLDADLAELITEEEGEERQIIGTVDEDEVSIIDQINMEDNTITSKVVDEQEYIETVKLEIDEIQENTHVEEESIVENIEIRNNELEVGIQTYIEEETTEIESEQLENIVNASQVLEIESEPIIPVKMENVNYQNQVQENTILDYQTNGKEMNTRIKRIIIIAVILVIGGFAAWVYSGYFDKFMVNQGLWFKVVTPPNSGTPDSKPIIMTSNKTFPADSVALNAIVEENEELANTEANSSQATAANTANNIDDTSEVKIKIEPGNTLRSLGLKYFGNKSFWVYIYEENKARIKSPNNVPVGTEITIPASSKYGINSKDAKSIEKARQLEQELYKQLSL